jgi:hypothetical protein
MRRREQKIQRAGLRRAEQCGAFGPRRVHHCPDVVHPLLERRQTVERDGVGHARAALVEQDQPGERCESIEEPREARLLPDVLDVRDPTMDEYEVLRSIADNLISDVQLAAARVSRLGGRHGW